MDTLRKVFSSSYQETECVSFYWQGEARWLSCYYTLERDRMRSKCFRKREINVFPTRGKDRSSIMNRKRRYFGTITEREDSHNYGTVSSLLQCSSPREKEKKQKIFHKACIGTLPCGCSPPIYGLWVYKIFTQPL